MTSRIHLFAALLAVAGAITGAAAMAADAVPSSRGPADKAQNRNAPLALPGRVVARRTPKVEAATLSRGIFGDNTAAGLASLGTVTLGADGNVTETPASDALRGVFEDSVRGHRSARQP
jgi:hypothetical protein